MCLLSHPARAIGLAALTLLFGSATARADAIGLVTITDATYQATCVGGGGTCTEVVNGTFEGDLTTGAIFAVSLQLTGTLTASLDGWFPGTGTCTGTGCLDGAFYDLNATPGDNPIEFSPTLDTIPELVPTNIDFATSSLFIPTLCGGDQPGCNVTGSFPSGNVDYKPISGTYTAVVLAPEPNAVILVATGLTLLAFMRRRKRLTD
jgi:hypothetical protein